MFLSKTFLHELFVEKLAPGLADGPSHCVALEVDGEGCGDCEGIFLGQLHEKGDTRCKKINK